MTDTAVETRSDNATLAAMDQLEVWLRTFRAYELGHRSRPTARRIWVDAVARGVPLVGGYLMSILLPLPYALGGAAVFALATVSVLGSWFHDGVHRNVRRPIARVLKRMGSSPVGFSPTWWLLKHVRLHHRYPGNPAFDPDIQFGLLARVSASQPWHSRHSTQHLHMWLAYPFATINMLKPNEPLLVRRYGRLLGLGNVPRTWMVIADKYVPAVLVWTPVFVVHGPLGGLLTFLAFHLTAGTLVSLITQVQHNTALSAQGGGDRMRWPLCDQLMRTSDVGHSRGVWWWVCGGVNFHVAHHLAPTLTFFELPSVTCRLRAGLGTLGYDLPAHDGLWTAVRSHAQLLRHLSRPDPESNN